jgi:hypothetical protein
MRIIERLTAYIEYKKIKPSVFEKKCLLANGYLKKQHKGKGSIGSEIIARIHKIYEDLNINWLMTGEGEMIDPEFEDKELKRQTLQEDKNYYTKDEMIKFLQERVALLETSLADKEKIIAMLEKQVAKKK